MPRLGGRTVVASCPAGKRLLGGGGESNNPNLVMTLNAPYDWPNGTAWAVGVQNIANVGQNGYVTANAICGTVQ